MVYPFGVGFSLPLITALLRKGPKPGNVYYLGICNSKRETRMKCMVYTQKHMFGLLEYITIQPSAWVPDIHSRQQCFYQAKPMFLILVFRNFNLDCTFAFSYGQLQIRHW